MTGSPIIRFLPREEQQLKMLLRADTNGLKQTRYLIFIVLEWANEKTAQEEGREGGYNVTILVQL